MPKSLHDILDHADALAQRFEHLDPDEAVDVSVDEYLLQRAVVARAKTEQQVIEAVIKARAAGVSWKRIGTILGTSAQAAQQRYGSVAEAS